MTRHNLVPPFIPGFERALRGAISVASEFSTNLTACKKSRRGVTIWSPDRDDAFFSGTNARADQRECIGADECRRDCPRICVHAEQVALMQWIRAGWSNGGEALHVKVIDGELVPSGAPSCVECSKLLLWAQIDGISLFHEDGWKRYEIREFHAATLFTLNLHGAAP